MLKKRKLCIVGAGGFGLETLASIKDNYFILGKKVEDEIIFLDDDLSLEEQNIMGVSIIHSNDFISSEYEVVVAIDDPNIRKRVVNNLPDDTKYTTLIHPNAILMENCKIGEGSIIGAGCILTCNIKIGKHCHLNLNTTIGHDCVIGDFFTSEPGVHVKGNCKFGNSIYIGSNAAIKQNIKICDDVTIGMGAVVGKDIFNKGTYIGNPLKLL